MADKLEYTRPTIKISEFSVQDIIRATLPVPCPKGDEPCDTDFCTGQNEPTNYMCTIVS